MKKIYRGTRKLNKFDKLSLSSSIINSNNTKLIKMFIKVLRNANINIDSIINILKTNDLDKNIINKFRELVKNPINSYNEKYNFKRAEFKWSFIKKHINKPINSILDFGGNVGDTAYYFGKQLGLSKDKINVVDI